MKTIISIITIFYLVFSALGQERLGSSFYTQSYYGFTGLTFIPSAQIFPQEQFGTSYSSEPSYGSNLNLLPYSLRVIYGFSGNLVELAATNTPFYASERLYNGVNISYGVSDYQLIMPIYPSVKYRIMQMDNRNYYVGMAIGFALPYGAYYVADKYFNVELFDLTVHTGVGTKLSTYHVFAGLTFTFGRRLNEIQRGFNLDMLIEAAWGGSLKELDKKEEAFVSLSFRHAWTSALYITTFIRYDNQALTNDGELISSAPTTLMAVGLEYHIANL
jgi:hypothetical protein